MKPKVLPYVFLLPAILAFSVFFLAPLVWMLKLSTYQTNFISGRYVGFGNYLKLFSDGQFWRSIENNVYYAILIVPLQTFIPLAVALTVVNMKKGVQDYVRFAFYAPVFASGIIITTVWHWIFHPIYGLANFLLAQIGIEPIMWFADRISGIAGIAIISGTGGLGGFVIIYLATCLALPKEITDSAQVDGAGWWQIKWHIYIPHLMPTIVLVSLISLIGTMQIWAIVFAMTNGGPNGGTESMMFNIYMDGFVRSRFGYSSAKSVVLTLIILILGILRMRLRKAE